MEQKLKAVSRITKGNYRIGFRGSGREVRRWEQACGGIAEVMGVGKVELGNWLGMQDWDKEAVG